jgi:hypothetical protein
MPRLIKIEIFLILINNSACPIDKNRNTFIFNSVCPNGYTEWAASCYKLYNQALKWTRARDFCRNAGGDLVTVGTEDENAFLYQMLQNASKYY